MYGGQQYTRSRDTWKVVGILAVLTIIVVSVAFAKLGDSELFSPALHSARADNLEAETEALRAQTAYQQQQYEIERRLAEAKAAVEVQALRDLYAIGAELLEWVGKAGIVVCSVLMVASAADRLCRAIQKAEALSEKQGSSRTQHLGQQIQSPLPQRGEANIPEHTEDSPAIQRLNVNPNYSSYDGLLAFAYDFFLANGRRLPPSYDYSQPDAKREYYPDGISADVAEFYVSVLKKTPILRMGNNGCNGWMILSPQINTLNDVKLRISQETFDSLQAVGQNGAG